MTTVEDVKRVLKEYAEQNMPGWRAASAMICPRAQGLPSEVLVALPDDDPTPPSPQLP